MEYNIHDCVSMSVAPEIRLLCFCKLNLFYQERKSDVFSSNLKIKMILNLTDGI